MPRKVQYFDVKIDKLTNSIENAFSGDSFDTKLIPISNVDLQQIKKGQYMGLIREPEGVNFVVDPIPLKYQKKKQISDIIAHYKKTGKVKKIPVSKKTKEKQTA